MLKQLVFACLAAVASSTSFSTTAALAEPTPHPRRGCSTGLTMPDDRCAPTGPALFEIDRIERIGTADHPRTKVLVSTKLYANGAWTVEDGATPRTATGYLDAAHVKSIRDDLAKASWRHLYSQPPCPPTPAVTTEVSSNGTKLWSEPACGDQLDADSVKLLAEIRGIIDAAVAPPKGH